MDVAVHVLDVVEVLKKVCAERPDVLHTLNAAEKVEPKKVCAERLLVLHTPNVMEKEENADVAPNIAVARLLDAKLMDVVGIKYLAK